jgi:sugar lactone lactonase YvrE
MRYTRVVILFLCFLPAAAAAGGNEAILSEKTLRGFDHPESVAYDVRSQHLFVSDFGEALKPTEKDGNGHIVRTTERGQVIMDPFLPTEDAYLHKPKGIWIQNGKLWVTDIDCVWLFSIALRKGRRLPLPGAVFANDPAVSGNMLYVSDSRRGVIYRVHPADFLDPTIAPVVDTLTEAIPGPNGLFPDGEQGILAVDYNAADGKGSVYRVHPDGRVKSLTEPIGRLDGLARLPDGRLLVTDWSSGTLSMVSPPGQQRVLAGGFKGPADLALIEKADRYTAVVPDLVTGNIRIVEFR